MTKSVVKDGPVLAFGGHGKTYGAIIIFTEHYLCRTCREGKTWDFQLVTNTGLSDKSYYLHF